MGAGTGAGCQARIAVSHSACQVMFFTRQSTSTPAITLDGSNQMQTLLVGANVSTFAQAYKLYVAGTSYFTGATTTAGAATINNPAGQGLVVSGFASIDASAGSSTALNVKGNGTGTALAVTGGNLTASADITAGRNITCNTPGVNSGVVTCLTLSSANKTFDIPHPTIPGMRLRHR